MSVVSPARLLRCIIKNKNTIRGICNIELPVNLWVSFDCLTDLDVDGICIPAFQSCGLVVIEHVTVCNMGRLANCD